MCITCGKLEQVRDQVKEEIQRCQGWIGSGDSDMTRWAANRVTALKWVLKLLETKE